jgi:hypothetical protein
VAFGFAQSVKGNPVPMIPPMRNPIISILLLTNMFFFGVGVEFAYFNSTLIKRHRRDYDSKRHYRTFLKINLVTFPLTQILAYFFYIYFAQFFWFYIILVEIGVIIIESYLLRIELPKLVDVEISPKVLVGKSFAANLMSFLVGLVAFLPLLLFDDLFNYLPAVL